MKEGYAHERPEPLKVDDTEAVGRVNDLFHEEATQATQQALKEMQRESLQGELEEVVGCKRYERSEGRPT